MEKAIEVTVTQENPRGRKKEQDKKIETQTEERAWKPTEIFLQHNTAGRREEEYLF